MTSEDEAVCRSHFEDVTRPVEARLQTLLALPNFDSKQTANDVRVQEKLKLILDMYSGIARASNRTCCLREDIAAFACVEVVQRSNLLCVWAHCHSRLRSISHGLISVFCIPRCL